MLSIIRHGTRITLRLTGRIEGSSAEDLRMAVCPPSALDIDLTRVTSVDQHGERALAWLRDRGARFQGEGTFARTLRERMNLSSSAWEEELHKNAAQQVGGKDDRNPNDGLKPESEVAGKA